MVNGKWSPKPRSDVGQGVHLVLFLCPLLVMKTHLLKKTGFIYKDSSSLWQLQQYPFILQCCNALILGVLDLRVFTFSGTVEITQDL